MPAWSATRGGTRPSATGRCVDCGIRSGGHRSTRSEALPARAHSARQPTGRPTCGRQVAALPPGVEDADARGRRVVRVAVVVGVGLGPRDPPTVERETPQEHRASPREARDDPRAGAAGQRHDRERALLRALVEQRDGGTAAGDLDPRAGHVATHRPRRGAGRGGDDEIGPEPRTGRARRDEDRDEAVAAQIVVLRAPSSPAGPAHAQDDAARQPVRDDDPL